MTKFNSLYETPSEMRSRLKQEQICREYLERSPDITSGKVLPNRVMAFLARRHGKTVMGVKYILRHAGIYQDAGHPVIIPDVTTVQAVQV